MAEEAHYSNTDYEDDALFLELSQQLDPALLQVSATTASATLSLCPVTSSNYSSASPPYSISSSTNISTTTPANPSSFSNPHSCPPIPSCSIPHSNYTTLTTPNSISQPKKSKRAFAEIKSDREVELARATSIPQKTKKDTKYCLSMWEAWCAWRQHENQDIIKNNYYRA